MASLDYLSREIADHWSGSERSARWGGIGKVRNEVRTSFGCDLAPDDPETLIFIIKWLESRLQKFKKDVEYDAKNDY